MRIKKNTFTQGKWEEAWGLIFPFPREHGCANDCCHSVSISWISRKIHDRMSDSMKPDMFVST